MINSCLSWRQKMRTTLALDDELVTQAQAYTGLKEKSALVREALKALVEREAARRLARLGGSAPNLTMPRRRRTRKLFWSTHLYGSIICGRATKHLSNCFLQDKFWATLSSSVKSRLAICRSVVRI